MTVCYIHVYDIHAYDMDIVNLHYKEGMHMASINMGSFFGGFNNSIFGSSSSLFSAMSDYNSIKSGSYYKLLKSYYHGNSKIDSASSVKNTRNNTRDYDYSTDAVKDNKTAATVRDSAKELKEDSLKLLDKGKNSVFNKVSVKKEDGTKSEEYDKDAIYKAVSEYVDSYNKTIKNASDSDNGSVRAAAKNIVNTTKSNSKFLSEVGISVGTDNKLSIDEKAFKAANMTDVKNLFNGVGSYAYKVSNSASGIYNQSLTQIARGNGSSYNNAGTYSGYSYAGSLYNSYL